jgi:hypothetical protein
MNVTASVLIELEIDLSGTYSPGYPARGPSYSCGGEPAEPAGCEDYAIEGLCAVVGSPGQPLNWKRVDLLHGCNRSSTDIQQLFANIASVIEDDARQAIVDAAGEDAADAADYQHEMRRERDLDADYADDMRRVRDEFGS